MHVPHIRQFQGGGLLCLTHQPGHMLRVDVRNPARGGDTLAKAQAGLAPALCAGFFAHLNQSSVFWGTRGGLFVAPWDGSRRGDLKRRDDISELVAVTCLTHLDGQLYAGGLNRHGQAVVYCLDDRQKGTYRLGGPIGEKWRGLDVGRGVRAMTLGPSKTLVAAAADGVFSWTGEKDGWVSTRSWRDFARAQRLSFPSHLTCGGRNDELIVATNGGVVEGPASNSVWKRSGTAPAPAERAFFVESGLVVIKTSGPTAVQTHEVWVRDRYGDKWVKRGELPFTPECCVELDRSQAAFSGRWPWESYREFAVSVVSLN